MPRGKKILKRESAPDAKYNSALLGKFINYIMVGGKKTTAQHIVYTALQIVADRKKEEPIKIFEEAINALRPHLEVRSRRVGGANYQVPMPVMGDRQNALAFRWIIGAARARKGKNMGERLALEMIDILEGVGSAIKKRDDVHRMAEANKAFAHFARFTARR